MTKQMNGMEIDDDDDAKQYKKIGTETSCWSHQAHHICTCVCV